MITKYKLYNESLKSLLVGPTKEEVWKNLGYDKLLGDMFKTPEELFIFITDDMTNKTKKDDCVFWYKKIKKGNKQNNILLFENTLKHNFLYVDNTYIWKILVEIFDYTMDEIKSFIKNMIEKHLGWFGFSEDRIVSMHRDHSLYKY